VPGDGDGDDSVGPRADAQDAWDDGTGDAVNRSGTPPNPAPRPSSSMHCGESDSSRPLSVLNMMMFSE
jgi:hypothetical protein